MNTFGLGQYYLPKIKQITAEIQAKSNINIRVDTNEASQLNMKCYQRFFPKSILASHESEKQLYKFVLVWDYEGLLPVKFCSLVGV